MQAKVAKTVIVTSSCKGYEALQDQTFKALRVRHNDAVYVVSLRDKEILGAALFHSFGACGCGITFWGVRDFITRRFIKVAYNYAFKIRKVHRVECRVYTDNTQSNSVVQRLGFQHEGTLRQIFKGKDMHMYRMLAGECKFLKQEN